MKKLITVVTPTYNEEDNVDELIERIRAVFAGLPDYTHEHLFIDNASTDGTVAKVKAHALADPRIKLIVNIRNFGHVRSPYYGLLQAEGEAAIILASDLQDPPELIPQFLERWEAGFQVVLGVKTRSEESPLFFLLRRLYYAVLNKLSDIDLTKNATGSGLYDQAVLRWLRQINDPYPYARGLICELGFPRATVAYNQPLRKRGITKNNFYTLYDVGMLGLVSHSKVPLRLAAMMGFVIALLSLVVAFSYLIAKLVLWNDFNAGQAPTLIGLFFFGAVQLIFIGIMGEYIGAIHTQVLKRPLVVEKERVNFEARAVVPEFHE